MEVVVNCTCGQAYQFETEPVNNEMPTTVTCPHCAKDGTADANVVIRQNLGLPPLATAAAPASVPQARVAAPSTAQSSASSRPGRISTSGDTSSSDESEKSARSGQIKGIVGAVVAGFIGMMAWFFLIKLTHYEIGYAAWGVGVLTGFGARVLTDEQTKTLGIVAGVCAFIAIIGGQYLATKSQFDEFVETAIKGAYDGRLAYAKEAVAAKNDEELRAIVTKHEQEDGEKGGPKEFDLAKFKTTELPELQKFAAGTPNKAAYEAKIRDTMNSTEMKTEILKSSVGIFTILWLFLGVGSAYKIASGGSDS